MNIGFGEILVIFIIILLLFGPSRLPQLARGLGQAMREFRKASSEEPETTEGEGGKGEKGEKSP